MNISLLSIRNSLVTFRSLSCKAILILGLFIATNESSSKFFSIICFSFFVKSSTGMTILQNDLKLDNNLFQYKSLYSHELSKFP